MSRLMSTGPEVSTWITGPSAQHREHGGPAQPPRLGHRLGAAEGDRAQSQRSLYPG